MAYQNGCKLPSAASDIYKVKILSACVLTAADAVKKTLLLKLNIKVSFSINVSCFNVKISCLEHVELMREVLLLELNIKVVCFWF